MSFNNNLGPAHRLYLSEDIPIEKLGYLMEVFKKRFSTWSLVPWFHCANDMRKQYDLMVIRSQTTVEFAPHLEEQYMREMAEAQELVHGFVAGLLAGKKSNHEDPNSG
jgi:hypothetical protein